MQPRGGWTCWRCCKIGSQLRAVCSTPILSQSALEASTRVDLFRSNIFRAHEARGRSQHEGDGRDEADGRAEGKKRPLHFNNLQKNAGLLSTTCKNAALVSEGTKAVVPWRPNFATRDSAAPLCRSPELTNMSAPLLSLRSNLSSTSSVGNRLRQTASRTRRRVCVSTPAASANSNCCSSRRPGVDSGRASTSEGVMIGTQPESLLQSRLFSSAAAATSPTLFGDTIIVTKRCAEVCTAVELLYTSLQQTRLRYDMCVHNYAVQRKMA